MPNANVIKFESHPSVISGTRVVLSEGMKPCRVVLRDDGRQFIVHNELLQIVVETRTAQPPTWEPAAATYDYVLCIHEAFDQGDYFQYGSTFLPSKEEALKRAMEVYVGRARRFFEGGL